MAENVEFLTGNRGIRYPFADDSTLPLEDALSRLVFGCFVDAAVQPKVKDLNTPKITGIYLQKHTLHFSLICEGQDAVDLSCTRTVKRYGTVTGDADCPWCWFVFTLSMDGIKALEDTDLPDISEAELELSPRCLGPMIGGVTSISIYDGHTQTDSAGRRATRAEAMESGPDIVISSGDVTFRYGYNTSFDYGNDWDILADSASKQFRLAADAGAGLGRIPCEEQEETVFRMPGLISPDGHTRIFNDTCYDFANHRTDESHGETKMHVKCTACCTCGMYEYIVNSRLVPLKNSILESRDTLDSTLATYETNVQKWNARLTTCLPDDIAISYTAVPLESAGTDLQNGKVKGRMSRCGVSITVRNDSFVSVLVQFSDFMSNGDAFEGQISYMKNSYTPEIIQIGDFSLPIQGFSLPTGRSAVLTYFIRLSDMVTTNKQTGFISNIKVTVSHDGVAIVSKTLNITV